MNETMLDLLKKWSGLEDVNCQPKGELFTVRYGAHQWYTPSPQFAPTDLMHIQAAVQQAIVARGWQFRLYSGYYAVVDFHGEEGDSAAEALLRAYVAVLKKEQG